ncbi:MAG TPA: class I SAM-dependent methyltransferase [Anaerolineaceae bacterium]|nr:class I SAM-dependent methyltransferase [Anaerolineaceae bacterium]
MSHPEINLLASPNWSDYELLDSGDGQKLERFGAYTFVRPEVQALWRKRLPATRWAEAHATFQPTGEESGGHWEFKKKVPERWEMRYPLTPTPLLQGEGREKHPLTPGHSSEGGEEIRFWAQTTPGRHLGVFPEGAAHWEWIYGKIKQKTKVKNEAVNVLNLFGYTGLATLAAAAAGAKVTHLDASKKAVTWARENQVLSGLAEKPVRWIVDDALKFVQREARRGVKYEGILLDPPKFGRGPKGELWEVYRSLPELLQACRAVISPKPLFAVLTVYAVKASAVHVFNAMEEMVNGLNGRLECGELVTVEKSAGRLLASAVYARWGEFGSSGET